MPTMPSGTHAQLQMTPMMPALAAPCKSRQLRPSRARQRLRRTGAVPGGPAQRVALRPLSGREALPGPVAFRAFRIRRPGREVGRARASALPPGREVPGGGSVAVLAVLHCGRSRSPALCQNVQPGIAWCSPCRQADCAAGRGAARSGLPQAGTARQGPRTGAGRGHWRGPGTGRAGRA
jgi:hypothetical protein